MFKPVTRNTIFRSSPFADNLIASIQRGYAADFDLSLSKDARTVKKFYDHQQPFQTIDPPIDGHCVLAYITETLEEYLHEVPAVLQRFFNALNIQQLYLLDFLKTTTDDFPFQNFKKRNDFRRLVGRNIKHGGYLVDAADLSDLLNLFFFSSLHGRPVIFFIPANGDVLLSIRLCSDGNFHLDFQQQHEGRIHEAARYAGFTIGDIDLCWDYNLFSYHRRHSLLT